MSPRNEEQNAQIKDERREQILSAALKVFAKRGFAATKISDIVAGTTMSHGLVYHYFRSKEEIFFELLKLAMITSAQSLELVDKLPLPPLGKVRQTASYILRGMEAHEDSAYYFLIVTHASVMEVPEENKELINLSGTALRVMVNILSEGQKTGEIADGDPFAMAIAFFAAIQGIAIYKLSMANFVMPDPELLVNMVKK